MWDSPDSIEGGEPLLDGVGRPCPLTVRIADAHRDEVADSGARISIEMRAMDEMRRWRNELVTTGRGTAGLVSDRIGETVPFTLDIHVTLRRLLRLVL